MLTSDLPMWPRRTPWNYAGLMARGFAMGSADVVPGVSGGTMAFILGIYEELIESIRMLGRPVFLKSVLGLQWALALQMLNWRFLACVGTGILLAVLTLAKALQWLLHHQPIVLWSFFFGLVLASVWVVSGRVKRWTPGLGAAMVAGALGAFWLVGMVPHETPDTWWFLFLSGALAISAMILPGISGAFILVLLNKYQYVLGAVTRFDLLTIGLVGAGALVGLVTVCQVLGWLFRRYHDATIALLTGLMLGSLRKVWPWKHTLESMVNRHGETVPTVQTNVLPAPGSEVLVALMLALAGVGLVLAMDRWGRAKSQGELQADRALGIRPA
jgi:putative membrane protein